jgi:lipopolysaccharide export system permease protein
MLKSYLGPFVFTFFVALFILLLQFLWKYLDDLVGKGLEWHIIAELMFYASSTFVPLALPLAILLSSLMTFGNLGEHYELVAVKAAGISLRKAMKPLVILSIILSMAAFYFSNWVLPVANLKFGSLLYDVRQQKLAFNLNEGIFNDGLDDIIIYVGEKDKDNQTIYNVKIYDHSSKLGNMKVVSAKKGIMELSPDQNHIIFTLYNGSRYTEITDTRGYRITRPFEVLHFEKFIRVFDLSEFKLNRTDEDLFKSHYSMLNIKQLNYSIDSLSTVKISRLDNYKDKFIKQYTYLAMAEDTARNKLAKKMESKRKNNDSIPEEKIIRYNLSYPLLDNFKHPDQVKIIDIAQKSARNARDNTIFYKNELENRQQMITKHQVVWHQKFKLSLACLIFFFIGAPLGAIIRKGGLGLPVVVSVIFFVLYHIVSITGEKAAKTGEWDVVFGSWLSTAMILPMGLFLTYKATTDAPLLDAESWKKFFDRFKILLFWKKKEDETE